jgi:hypothetical protein
MIAATNLLLITLELTTYHIINQQWWRQIIGVHYLQLIAVILDDSFLFLKEKLCKYSIKPTPTALF